MKITLIALLTLNLVCGTIYHFMVVNELKTDLYVEQELFKACTAENMWLELQLADAGCVASAYQATKNGFDLEENLEACR